MDKQQLLLKILKTFLISLAFAGVGLGLGTFVPPSLMLPLIIFELVILLIALFFRKKRSIGYGFLYFFTTLTGVTTYPVVTYYVSDIGANMVLVGLLSTIIIFTSLALYSWKSKKDFTFLGGILFAALVGLIVLWILSIFFPFGSTMVFLMTLAGILVFSGFILYDISVIKNADLTEEDVPLMALNLYLDFLNLFINILRFLGIISSND